MALIGAPATVVADDVRQSSTDKAMYFHSHISDAPACAVTAAADGTFTFAPEITNPAATCPDAFAWTQFLGAIQAEFWQQWANDETVWVAQPKPLCTADRPDDCCFVDAEATPQVGYRDAAGEIVAPAVVGGPGEHCPYIPADWGGAEETEFAGGKPFRSHNTTFLRTLDPARIARQQEVEVVYRNDSFVRYATENELYSRAGLAKLFATVAGEAAHSRPYRPTGQGVSFPPDAVMFKVDWIAEATMIELGYLEEDPNAPGRALPGDRPYVTQTIKASHDGGKTYQEGLYFLAAITGASKALPNWHWYAFEHVDNLGRCDFTGCNDSYGFTTEVTIYAPEQPAGDAPTATQRFDSNFVPPHVIDDQLDDDQDLFDLGKRYPSGAITDGLRALFEATGIGAGTAEADGLAPADPAWRNYRLKGTQTEFVGNDGYPTIVGASITEGGFVNSASCLSCHVQASVDAAGKPGTSVGGTGRLNLFGIGTSVNGPPEVGDYYLRGTTQQHAVPTDFVWGILFAE
ncbi:MAG: hypothetical protein ACOCYE_12190 [Pseudomonadota bacterium]